MNYTFRNKDTGEEFTKSMKLAEREPFLKDNPHLEQIIVAPTPAGDSVRLGFTKADGVFRDRLAQIKSTHPNNRIDKGNLTNI